MFIVHEGSIVSSVNIYIFMNYISLVYQIYLMQDISRSGKGREGEGDREGGGGRPGGREGGGGNSHDLQQFGYAKLISTSVVTVKEG